LRGDRNHVGNVRGGAGESHRATEMLGFANRWLDIANAVGRIQLNSKELQAQS